MGINRLLFCSGYVPLCFRLGPFSSVFLVSYWLWWELAFVWGLYKTKTYSYFFSSIDLKKILNFALQFCFVLISAWWIAKWESDLLIVKARISLYTLKALISFLFLLSPFSFYVTSSLDNKEKSSYSHDDLLFSGELHNGERSLDMKMLREVW